MDANLITVTQSLYYRLNYLKAVLSGSIYTSAKIEFSPEEETLRLRLGETTLVYCNLERDEYEVFHCRRRNDYDKVASGLSQAQTLELLKAMPESNWHVDTAQFTRLSMASRNALRWVQNFMKIHSDAI